MKVCLIGELSHLFVKRDYELLLKHFDVVTIEPPKTKIGWIKYPLKIAKKLKENDVAFCWFAGWHTAPAIFFSKIYGKKSIVVVGGYDAANVPEIKYGAFSNIKERIPAKYVLKNADLLIAVSKFTQQEVKNKVKVKKINVVYNGVDVDKFTFSNEKQDIVITVSAINRNNLIRKGLETFVRTAKLLPETKFVVIGKYIDDAIEYLRSIASNNVEFTGFISDDEILHWYQRAKVICQLSYYEAFGLAPAEGMSCGCIPIVTKERTGIPEFVGDAGYYVQYGDLNATAEAIKKALNDSFKLAEKSRNRIVNMFSLQMRENKLIEIIKNKW